MTSRLQHQKQDFKGISLCLETKQVHYTIALLISASPKPSMMPERRKRLWVATDQDHILGREGQALQAMTKTKQEPRQAPGSCLNPTNLPHSLFESFNQLVLFILIFYPIHTWNYKLWYHSAFWTRPEIRIGLVWKRLSYKFSAYSTTNFLLKCITTPGIS